LRLCTAGTPAEQRTGFSILYGFVGPRLAGETDPEARKAALEEAGFRSSKEMVKVCAVAAKHSEANVRFRASLLLCMLGDPRGRAAVEKQLFEDLAVVRRQGRAHEKQQQRRRMEAHKKGRKKFKRRSMDDTRELNRAKACLSALAGVADKELADKLVPVLSEGQGWGKEWHYLQARVVTVLGKVAHPSYVDPLHKFMNSRVKDAAKATAARALGKLGARKAFDDMLRLVKPMPDDQYYDEIRRSFYVGMLGADPARAYAEIGKILKNLEAHNAAGFENMVAFYMNHPDPRAVEPLVHWVNHDVRLIREVVHDGLEALGREDVGWLIEGFEVDDSGKRTVLAGAIADGFGHKAVPKLVRAMEHESPKIRQGAVWALGCIGGREASEAVGKGLKDEHEAVRAAAAWSAGRLRNPVHVPPMIALLADEHEMVRAMAAEQLGEMDSQDAVKPLLGLLDDEDPQVRGKAAMSLAELGAEQALPAVRKLLDDEDPEVRTAASYAVKKLGAG
jgi:HEAT repeat protein